MGSIILGLLLVRQNRGMAQRENSSEVVRF